MSADTDSYRAPSHLPRHEFSDDDMRRLREMSRSEGEPILHGDTFVLLGAARQIESLRYRLLLLERMQAEAAIFLRHAEQTVNADVLGLGFAALTRMLDEVRP